MPTNIANIAVVTLLAHSDLTMRISWHLFCIVYTKQHI